MSDRHTPPTTVVGVAVLHAGRVLAAERLEGGWELPGGKVEPGESESAAGERELVEELDLRPRLVQPLPGSVPIAGTMRLRVWFATIDADPGPLEPRVHRTLRWLGPDELDDVDWLPADRPFLPALRVALTHHP